MSLRGDSLVQIWNYNPTPLTLVTAATSSLIPTVVDLHNKGYSFAERLIFFRVLYF